VSRAESERTSRKARGSDSSPEQADMPGERESEPKDRGPEAEDRGPEAEDRGPEAADRGPETPFEELAASWVPPWARALPELVVEPAADYPREEPPLGRPLDDQAMDEEEPHPDDYEPGMADQELRAALEAILLVVDEPVTELLLAQVVEEPPVRVEATLHALAEEYVRTGRGFGGWRLYTRAEYATYVERFVLDGQQARLTQAALETLAVVAYKQPVTRSRISAIRGVNCDGVIKTLLNRGLVEECGTEAESGAHLYQTTRLFLEKLGINGVDELPPLAPFLPDNVDEIDIAHR
jgi:segregation and condensation protein B